MRSAPRTGSRSTRRASVTLHLHWSEDRVVDVQTLQATDREKQIDICLALNNEGYYLFSFGAFLLSTAVTEHDIDEFLAATESALKAVDLI